MSPEADPDGIAEPARNLRAARDELLPAEAASIDHEIHDSIKAISDLIDQAGVGEMAPEMKRLAHEIRLAGTQMAATREDTFDDIAHLLGTEADDIEALLRPADTTGAGSPFGTATPPPEPVPESAPTPVPESVPVRAPDLVSTAHEANVVAQQLPDGQAVRRRINQAIGRFPPKLQALARILLFAHLCHVVQRHGHHLRLAHQLARAQWLLDPARVDRWQLNPDGSVRSERWDGGPHRVGTASGHYTTPEAVAKPLIALLNAAGRTQAELDAYLDGKAEGKTSVSFFLRTSDTGITSDDVFTVRAPGTDTKYGEKMWKRARSGAMAGDGDAPAVREYDLVTRGKKPGSLIIFIRRPNQPWRLLTSYFSDNRPNKLTYTEL